MDIKIVDYQNSLNKELIKTLNKNGALILIGNRVPYLAIGTNWSYGMSELIAFSDGTFPSFQNNIKLSEKIRKAIIKVLEEEI